MKKSIISVLTACTFTFNLNFLEIKIEAQETSELYDIKANVLNIENYDPKYDYNSDNVINVFDVIREKRVKYFNSNVLYTDISMFNSVGAIGDSYTHGDTTNSLGKWVTTGSSWIKTMATRAHTEYANYGQGGLNCKNYDMQAVLNDKPHDMYFYAMGINDSEKSYNEGESSPLDHLGTIEDIKDDYTQNADTFYGWYGRIISQVMIHAPKARHCMILIPIKGKYKQDFNDAIVEIANYYNIPYINPFDDDFFYSDIYLDKATGHPTRAGYVGMGLAYERLFSKCVEENTEYFKYSVIN